MGGDDAYGAIMGLVPHPAPFVYVQVSIRSSFRAPSRPPLAWSGGETEDSRPWSKFHYIAPGSVVISLAPLNIGDGQSVANISRFRIAFVEGFRDIHPYGRGLAISTLRVCIALY